MIPLFSAEQVRLADKFAINELQIPSIVLMENAAISITNEILKKYPYIDTSYRFGIICGKGNNGGDGFALARHLLIKGFSVYVISLGVEKELKGDALTNYKILSNFIQDYENSTLVSYNSIKDINSLKKCDVIIDSILGTGSSGKLKEPIDSLVKKINSISSLKIAIDSPTGLNLDNASGENIFKADLTVTLAGLKNGLFYGKGRSNSGKVVKGSIGMGQAYFADLDVMEYLVEPEDVVNSLPTKNDDIHKYSAGKVYILAGSKKMPGAAVFATNAAMISGAGAGILGFPNSIESLAQGQMNSAIVSSYDDKNMGFLNNLDFEDIVNHIKWADAAAIGPGLGREKETQEMIVNLLKGKSSKKLVLDADALFPLANNKFKNFNLRDAVLTPHHGEFSNLISVDLEDLKSNILQFGKNFCKETGAYLVLKGAPTITFNPMGEAFINSSGNSGLAKFGSGDVLTGFITSFMSQQEDIEKSIIAAVYLHGLTADLILKEESEYSITPPKLIEKFSSTIKFLRKSIV